MDNSNICGLPLECSLTVEEGEVESRVDSLSLIQNIVQASYGLYVDNYRRHKTLVIASDCGLGIEKR